MPRLKPPAYGKQLLEARRRGETPLVVNLVYGDRWWDVEAPKVCLKPEEFAPGKYDFHVLAGLKVVVHDQLLAIQNSDPDSDPPVFDKFFDLLREVAQFAARVEVEFPKAVNWRNQNVRDIAWAMRIVERKPQRRVWPHWWSDELDAALSDRYYTWLQDDAVARGLIDREHVRAA